MKCCAQESSSTRQVWVSLISMTLLLGPVCVAHSSMGKMLREQDPRFRTHTFYYACMRRLCDAVLLENVPGYRVEVAQSHLGPEWETRHAIIDPRIFGVPCARTRLYIIAWKRSKLEWRQGADMSEIIDILARRVVTCAKACWWMDLPKSQLTKAQAESVTVSKYSRAVGKSSRVPKDWEV